MKLEKAFIFLVITSLLATIPITIGLGKRADQIKIERNQNQHLRWQVDSVEKHQQKAQEKLEQEQKENQDLKKHNKRLKKRLQAKLERRQQAKVAANKPKPSPAGGSCESYRPLVAKYDWDVNVAMAIMQAESSCIPDNVGGPNWNGTYDHGLFQLNNVPIYDPAENVKYAYYNKYKQGGWGHWTVYKTGQYRKYL